MASAGGYTWPTALGQPGPLPRDASPLVVARWEAVRAYPTIFDQRQDELTAVMSRDTFPRFCDSAPDFMAKYSN
jgi:hypothetical protein